MKKLFQPYYLVTISPWPILTSFSIMITFIGVMIWFNTFNFNLMVMGISLILICSFQWWRDIIRESTFQGLHTKKIILNLKSGMILFIISEIFFFISIFWCYFHMFLSPSIEIGSIWPPKNIESFNPYNIPLLNTIILLSSGISMTWSHYSVINSMKKNNYISLLITIMLGLIFTMFQYYEYMEASFTISDSIYGSIFFMATGFHGLHVLIGTIFLMINFMRFLNMNYSSLHHFGYEAAIWYWHFVDVVWLFLYILIYFWSN